MNTAFSLADNSYALVIERGFVAHDDQGNASDWLNDGYYTAPEEEEREQLLAREQTARRG